MRTFRTSAGSVAARRGVVQHNHCFGQVEPRAGEAWTKVVVIMTAPNSAAMVVSVDSPMPGYRLMDGLHPNLFVGEVG
jgi:hypothetical protein